MVDRYVNNARATWITPAPNGTFLLELSQRLLGNRVFDKPTNGVCDYLLVCWANQSAPFVCL
jgi:hypothetical protein